MQGPWKIPRALHTWDHRALDSCIAWSHSPQKSSRCLGIGRPFGVKSPTPSRDGATSVEQSPKLSKLPVPMVTFVDAPACENCRASVPLFHIKWHSRQSCQGDGVDSVGMGPMAITASVGELSA